MVGHAIIVMMGPIKSYCNSLHCIESHINKNPRINAALTSFVMVGHCQAVMVGHGENNVCDV